MNIEKVENGYIVTYGLARNKRIFATLLDVFRLQLLHFEGKSESFGGGSFARVELFEVDK